MRTGPCLLSTWLFLSAGTPLCAADYAAGPEDYRSLLPRLRAGDTLRLRAGDYVEGLPLRHLSGEAGRPIVIEGEQGTRFLARAGRNTVSLLDVRHLCIRNLELDGQHLPVDAVKAEGHGRYAHYVTLENLHIHDHDAHQQNVGISSKCPAFGWVVRGNRIERVGTGMYFGDSDGSDPFVAGLIENNHVRDSIGYNLQIKHQHARPSDLPEAALRHDTVIRGNVFSKEAAWADHAARPNVLVGHMPLQGEGAQDRVLVHGNLFWQNPSEALFQGEGHLVIYNNIFVNSQGHAVHIQPHNDVPRRVDLFHNTVLARGHGIRILQKAGMPPSWRQRVSRNLIFAGQPLQGGESIDNLSGHPDTAARFLNKPHAKPGEFDFSPRLGLAGEVWPDTLDLGAYADSGLDIDRHPRHTPVLGACSRDAPAACPDLAKGVAWP